MTFGDLKKAMEIAPDTWNDLELRVCWGVGPTQQTSLVTSDELLKIRFDTDTVDHDAQTRGVAPQARYCYVFFAQNPLFDGVKIPT